MTGLNNDWYTTNYQYALVYATYHYASIDSKPFTTDMPVRLKL